MTEDASKEYRWGKLSGVGIMLDPIALLFQSIY
jgi:hypothetical protein